MASVDPVAQSVEHNTFNVGVPGSSPGGVTEEISDNQMIVGDFFVYTPLRNRVPLSKWGAF